MKARCTRGFGKVEHPETGEEINVEEPFKTDRETFEALDAAYPGFEVVDPEGESAEDTDAEPEDGVDTSDDHWRSVVSAIESGEYDDVLDDISDGRESVQNAIAERQSELSG